MKTAGNVIKRRLQCNYRSRNYKVIVSVYNVSVIDGPPANYIPTHDDKVQTKVTVIFFYITVWIAVES